MEAVIRSELRLKTGLALLALQNHIYGCFLLMEDIAQQTVTLAGFHVQPHGWNLDRQFWEIGMRYGFIMDAQLTGSLVKGGADYKAAWLAWFQEVAVKKSIEEVDAMEDRLIRMLRETIPAEEAYFVYALESGELPMVWKERAVRLLLGHLEAPVEAPLETPLEAPKDKEEPIVYKEEPKVYNEEPIVYNEEPKVYNETSKEEPKVYKEEPKVYKEEPKVYKEEPKVYKETALEPKKLLEKHRDNPKRMFATTRRQRMVQGRKTILSTTRRHVH